MPRKPGLSPSRANDFDQCPLMFRLRVIDQIPEPPSSAAALGTLVHDVLERLYDLPAAQRTEAAAVARLKPTWRDMVSSDETLGDLHEDPASEAAWLHTAAERLATYFTLENPQRLEPAAREEYAEVQLNDGPLIRGVIDRIDVAPDGQIRVVDYKTGKSPAPQYGQQAKFQMRFYALLTERRRGRIPTVLQLLYLRDGVSIVLNPTREDIEKVEHEVRETWSAITSAARSSQWRTKKSKLCAWCSFQSLCPEFGAATPAIDPDQVEAAIGVRPGTG